MYYHNSTNPITGEVIKTPFTSAEIEAKGAELIANQTLRAAMQSARSEAQALLDKVDAGTITYDEMVKLWQMRRK